METTTIKIRIVFKNPTQKRPLRFVFGSFFTFCMFLFRAMLEILPLYTFI